jgi:hypothetical protein
VPLVHATARGLLSMPHSSRLAHWPLNCRSTSWLTLLGSDASEGCRSHLCNAVHFSCLLPDKSSSPRPSQMTTERPEALEAVRDVSAMQLVSCCWQSQWNAVSQAPGLSASEAAALRDELTEAQAQV